MREKLGSRKLWVAIFVSMIVTLNEQLGLMPAATLEQLVTLAISYLIGQGAVDVAKEAFKNKKSD